MNDIVQIALGVGLFLAITLLVWLIVLLSGLAKHLKTSFATIDQSLVGFGQTATGRLTNQAVETAKLQFDQASDPAIIRITDLMKSVSLIVMLTRAVGIELTYDKVAIWGRAIFDALDELTDGKPVDAADEAIKTA